MFHLDELENRTIYIIREAYFQFKKIGMLWSIGKDSTALLWLCRKAFFGKIPFSVIHIDTDFKFKEIYSFRDKYAKEWKLDLQIARNDAALKAGMNPKTSDKFSCCTQLKTEALKQHMRSENYEALLLAIRRDEHGIRAKERYFSPRDEKFSWDYKNQPAELWNQYNQASDDETHIRVHPILHWTELDIWDYIKQENIPMVSLYFAKNGKRFRSIGCETCCDPIDSNADSIEAIIEELRTTNTRERAGRAQDKENAYTMQKLRALGYM